MLNHQLFNTSFIHVAPDVLFRMRLMQEFERGKSGSFTLRAKERQKKWVFSTFNNKENIDALFEAYGTLPDVATFRGELIRKGIVDDDVYFELIERNEAIPYGIIDYADMISSWSEMKSYKIFKNAPAEGNSCYTMVGALNAENYHYPLYGYHADDDGDNDENNQGKKKTGGDTPIWTKITKLSISNK